MKLRHPLLRKIEGTYDCEANLTDENSEIARFLLNTPNNKVTFKDGVCYINNQRAGKFLNKCGFDNDVVAKFLEHYTPLKVTISCRFKDIINATTSKYMNGRSCFYSSSSRSNAVSKILEDETMAVYLLRDKAGHIQCRGWIRLVKSRASEKLLYFPYKPYGNGVARDTIIKLLQGINNEVEVVQSLIQPLVPIIYWDDYFNR